MLWISRPSKIFFSFLVFLFALSPSPRADSIIPFSQKLIFSDTPEMGLKWHGGIRMQDVFIWDFGLNVYNWVYVDYLAAGLSKFKTEEGDKITDNFYVLTFKSPAFTIDARPGIYKLAGGLKGYGAQFRYSSAVDSSQLNSDDQSLVLFLTQSLRHDRHYLNLFSSVSFREIPISDTEKRTSTTFYLTPGYQYSWSNGWHVGGEYYLTNTEKLPIKVLQFVLDKDRIEFHNPNQDLYSFLFWGFHYTRQHLRVDLHIGNHISFQPPFIPVLGVGWFF